MESEAQTAGDSRCQKTSSYEQTLGFVALQLLERATAIMAVSAALAVTMLTLDRQARLGDSEEIGSILADPDGGVSAVAAVPGLPLPYSLFDYDCCAPALLTVWSTTAACGTRVIWVVLGF